MADLNQCNLCGRLVRDPEVRYTATGLAICNFTIANNRKYKNEEKVLFLRVVAFEKLAEICGEYLTAKKQVNVSGELQVNKWEDKDGNKRETPELLLRDMQMLGAVGANNDPGSRKESFPSQKEPESGNDDIPF